MSDRKTALVTGASNGIGRSAALALARAGYDVAINYRSSDAEARAVAAEAERLGATALLCKCDVSDDAGVRAMLRAVDGKFAKLDALINNAGTTTEVQAQGFRGA